MIQTQIMTVRLGDIVLDESIRVRGSVISGISLPEPPPRSLVDKYAEDMRNGDVFPLVKVNRRILQLVDGWIRHAAMLSAYGPDAEVAVEAGNYGSEDEMIMDAIARNMRTGT